MWKKVMAITLILALGVSVIWAINPLSPAIKANADTYKGGFSVTAQKSDDSGVDTDSLFYLTSNNEITLDYLKENLSIRGQEPPEIEPSENGSFKIKPKEALKQNSLYFIDIKAQDGRTVSFAFQTKKEFSVIGSLPQNMSSNVPVDTGIELYFSYPDVENINNYFEITPRVDGRFEEHGYARSFIPKKLEPGTIYTVKVKKGLTAANGAQVLVEDYSFSFETSPDISASANPDTGSLMLNNSWFDFSTEENPVIPFDLYIPGNRDLKNVEVAASLYRFPDMESFVKAVRSREQIPSWAWYSYNKEKIDSASLEKVLEYKQSYNLEMWTPRFIMLPESIKDGFYLIELTTDKLSAQAFVQATDTSAFFMEDSKGGIFWVNDLISGNAVINAAIEDMTSGKSARTDNSGIARLDGTSAGKTYDNLDLFKITTADGKVSLLNAGYPGHAEDANNNQTLNWRYIQTDRTLYKPNDQVQFWGFIKSRIDGSTPAGLTVELSEGGYYPMRGGFLQCYLPFLLGKPLETVTINAKGGFFEGNMQLPSLDPGSYNLTVKSGDKVLASSYITVDNYIKPQYKLDITSDKKAVFIGEKVTFNIQASFFDGTPVANVPIRYFVNNWNGTTDEGSGVTDLKGALTVEYTPDYTNGIQGECYSGISVSTTLPETGEISQYYNFRVFANDIHLLTNGELKDNRTIVTVTAHNVELDTLNDEDLTNDKFLGALMPGIRADVKLYANSWDKVEIGDEYDFINKVVRKRYEYREKQTLLTEKMLLTGQDGTASFEYPVDKDFEGHYSIEVTSYDRNGRKMTYRNGFYNQKEYPGQWDYYNLRPDKNNYAAGETVSLQFYNGDNPVMQNKTLFVESRNGIIGYDVKPQPKYIMPFNEEFSPNYYVDGIMFTGKGYIQSSCPVAYQYEEKKLIIKAETDKESYKPGDECTIKISASDKDGKPVAAMVNISLVDEALLKLSGQHIDPLGQLYSWINSGIIRYSTSRTNRPIYTEGAYDGDRYGSSKVTFSESINTAADMPMPSAAPVPTMGKEDESFDLTVVRSDFKDTACFQTVELNDKGEGTLTFRLPDNITSFSLSAAAISTDLHAGSEITTARVSMPFFINDAVSLSYLEGDIPYIGVTAYGQELDESENIEFEIRCKELSDYVKKASGKAFERVNIPLPKLSEGTYSIEIYARSQEGLTDALKRTVQVYSSYRTIEASSLKKLISNVAIDAGNSGLTTLVVTDEGRGKIINSLHGLSWGYGHRLDQKLTAFYAQKLLKEILNSDELYFNPIDIDVPSYRNSDGGFGILPYAESDIRMTALLAPYLKDVADASSLKMYFYNAMLSGSQVNAAALYGLAVLGEPVLLDLEKARHTENLSLTDYMLIGMAYAALDETSTAIEIFNGRIRSGIENKDPYVRVKVKNNNLDECLEQTALLAAFTSKLDMPDADKMFAYISGNYSKNVYTGAERLIYLEERLKKLPDETVAFDYTYNGASYTVKLEKGQSELIKIPSVKAKDFKVTGVSGSASILSLYTAPLNQNINNDSNVSIIRKYYNALTGEEMTTFSQNDIVKVEITYDVKDSAIDNVYEISDYAPSGLKPIDNPWSYGARMDYGWFYRSIDGQKVTFVAGKHQDKDTLKPLVYYARVASPGEYVAEGTIAQGSIVKDSMTTIESTIIRILP